MREAAALRWTWSASCVEPRRRHCQRRKVSRAWARDRGAGAEKAEADEGRASVIDDGDAVLAVSRAGRSRWRGREIVDPR
jgi:hypothetical protein